MGKSILGLLPKPHVRATGGRIVFEDRDLLALSEDEMRVLRGKRIAMIFQEPMTALNPLMMVGRQIDEVLEIHTDLKPHARRRASSSWSRTSTCPNPSGWWIAILTSFRAANASAS